MKFDDTFCRSTYEVIRIAFSADCIKFKLPPTIWCRGYEYHSEKLQYEFGIAYVTAIAHIDRDWKTMGYIPPERWPEPNRTRFLGVSGRESAGFRLRLRRLSTG